MKHHFLVAALGATLLALATPSMAASTVLIASPASWRMQYSFGGGMYLYFTGASGCTNGQLSAPSTASTDELNRFWSLMLTAKSTGASVGIIYESTTCTVTSFFATP